MGSHPLGWHSTLAVTGWQLCAINLTVVPTRDAFAIACSLLPLDAKTFFFLQHHPLLSSIEAWVLTCLAGVAVLPAVDAFVQ